MSIKGLVIRLLVGIIVVATLLGAYGLGNSRGYAQGYNMGYVQAYDEGLADGYDIGVMMERADHEAQPETVYTIEDYLAMPIGLTPVEAAMALIADAGYTHDQAAAELAAYYARTGTTGPLLPTVLPPEWSIK